MNLLNIDLPIIVWIVLYLFIGFVLATINEILKIKLGNKWPFWDDDGASKYGFFFLWPAMIIVSVFLYAVFVIGHCAKRTIGPAITKLAKYFTERTNKHVKRKTDTSGN